IFSSEAKPIAAAGVKFEPNRTRLFEYLRLGLLDHSADTLFEGISQLRPGTYLTFDGGNCSVHSYWDLAARAPAAGDVDQEAALAEISPILDEAVDLHLRGEVGPAPGRSPGPHSQPLRGVIQRDKQRPGLACFTYCFPGTPYDECAGSGELSAHVPIRWHGTPVPSDDLIPRLGALIGA